MKKCEKKIFLLLLLACLAGLAVGCSKRPDIKVTEITQREVAVGEISDLTQNIKLVLGEKKDSGEVEMFATQANGDELQGKIYFIWFYMNDFGAETETVWGEEDAANRHDNPWLVRTEEWLKLKSATVLVESNDAVCKLELSDTELFEFFKKK